MKLFRLLTLSAIAIAMSVTAAEKTHVYNGIRSDDPGASGLANPERGFRLECIFGMGNNPTPFGCGMNVVKMMDQDDVWRKYFSECWTILGYEEMRPWGVSIAQNYVYLTDYYDTPVLPDSVLENLQRSFDTIRKIGVKSIIRFSYETNTLTPWQPPKIEGLTPEQIEAEKAKQAAALAEFQADEKRGPTVDIVVGHIRQLAPLFEKNKDVIYIMEMGFLGAWGEWHSMRRIPYDDWAGKARVLDEALKALPADRMVTMRSREQCFYTLQQPPFSEEPAVITEEIAFSGSERSRIGQNNDAFMVPSDERWVFMVDDPAQLKKGESKLYDEACSESLFVPSGGEMWWRLVGGIIRGQDAILRLREHHYDYLSLVHSYGYTEPENINFWMQTPITPEWLKENNLPVDDGYFDAAGLEKGTARRTAFEYIRDHLGYRFELKQATWEEPVAAGQRTTLRFSLVNNGFKGMINPRPVYLVLIDYTGTVVSEMQIEDADPRRWYPHAPEDPDYRQITHEITFDFMVPELEPGKYFMGLWLPDATDSLRFDSRYAVRFANRNAPFFNDTKYGVNILGTFIVK